MAAMVVLGFMELPEEDVPDELIWHHPELMEQHWDDVKERRKHPQREVMEDVPTTDNELAAQYRLKGRKRR